MADWGTSPPSLGEDGSPTHPVPVLALNNMGSFDWDLARGLLHLDAVALRVFGLPGEGYDGGPELLRPRLPASEARRVRTVVDEALDTGADTYGTYFRVRLGDGTLRWAHAQGSIRRDAEGRGRRIIGLLRNATDELGEAAPHRRHQQRRQRKLRGIVQNTTTALARAHTVQDVIDVLKGSHNMEQLGTSSMVLGLIEAGRVHVVAASPESSLRPSFVVTRLDERYPMSDVVRTLEPLFLESSEEFGRAYPELWDSVRGLGTTAAAYLPLIAQARPIGAVGLLYHGKTEFSDEDRNLLLALASSIAQSLQRAMFYDQAKDLAQSLQQAMLPHRIPDVPGADVAVRYRSASLAREIGGDWYDVIPLPGGRYGAVIGDVQGHDTHAAAVMGQLRIVLRAYAAEGHAPATVMARASVFLHELDRDRFATCIYAEADLTSGVVQLVRAGHLAPLLRQIDGTCRVLEIAGGLPLGHSEEFGRPEYDVTTLELAPGQSLLLFTDGLVEQPGVDLDDGIASLAEQVGSGPQDLELLAEQLCSVVDERGGADDVALLLLRRRSQSVERPGVRLRRTVEPGDPLALSGARHMIKAAGLTLGAGDRSDEIELVADEMITNVLVHTEGAAIVTLRLLSGAHRRLRVEVEDISSALPRRRDIAAAGVSGRGLLLVDRLADVWGVEPRGGGKCVWSEFRIPGLPRGG